MKCGANCRGECRGVTFVCALLYTLFVYMMRVSASVAAGNGVVDLSLILSARQNQPLYRTAPHVSSILFRTKYTCSLRVHPPLFDGCHYTRTIERCNQIVYRSGVFFLRVERWAEPRP